MKHRTVSGMLVTFFCILALSGITGASAAFMQTQEEHEPNTSVAPVGHVPVQQQTEARISATGDANILLVQTSLPWNSDANTRVLDSLGYSYDVVDINGINDVDISSYPVVLIVNDQVQAFYDQYAAQVVLFEDYVASGGVIVFFAAGAGWAGGQLTAPLPGGVTWVSGYDPTNHIVDNLHPIVTGALSGGNLDWGGPLMDSDLIGNYCSHGYLDNVPENAHIVLASDIWNEPTLMVYTIGGGRVIASTLTWEAYWAWGGAFAKKALDDVFLYAFSGGGAITNDIQVDLRAEDAPDSIRVKKSGGSYLDITARVTGQEAYTLTLTLKSRADLFNTPAKTFTRNSANNSGYGQENAYTTVEPGTTQINTTLASVGQSEPAYYKEVVWRFQIPDSATAQNGVPFEVVISAPGLIVPRNNDQVMIDIVKHAQALAITDRQRLYDTYEVVQVSNLLEEVYRSVDSVQGEVFYVDHYDVAWEYKTDVTDLNNAAQVIDNKIEDWYSQLEDGGYKPNYLMIVGGDNIIPFYRMNDSDYKSCWLPKELVFCEEDGYGKKADLSHPIGYAYHNNHFLSDNIYGDVGGGKSDWEQGKLELAVGRIVGQDASAMTGFISNGMKVSKVSETGFAVILPIDYDGFSGLDGRDIKFYGFEDPDLVDNDDWDRSDFMTVWESNLQFYNLGLHANPLIMSPVSGGGEDRWIKPENLTQSQINNNHPIMSTLACNLAVPVEGGIVYREIDLGIGGFVGSTGLAEASSFGKSGAETLINLYGENLFPRESSVSTRFGEALLQAKQDFKPTGMLWSFTGTDKKAILEYVFYGVPWGRVEINTPLPSVKQNLGDGVRQPRAANDDTYTQIIQTRVQSYTLSPVDNYDLLKVPGSSVFQDEGAPSIPFLVHTVNLPPGSSVEGLTLVTESATDLGVRHVPSVSPVTTYNPEPVLQDVSGVTGLYPVPRYTYEVIPYDTYTEVRVMVALAQYDVDSGNLTLFDDTELQLTYRTSVSALLEDVRLIKDSFAASENVVGSGRVRNVVGDTRTFTAELVIYDMLDVVQATQIYPDFSVAPGEAYTLDIDWTHALPSGHYDGVLNLYESGTLIGFQSASFRILAGELAYFDAPASLAFGEYGVFSLGFANHTTSQTNVAADVYIYDQQGLLVSKLLQQSTSASPLGTVNFDWTWRPDSLVSGEYLAQAIVTLDGDSYSSSGHMLMLGDVYRATTALISPNVQTDKPGAQVVYQVQLENTGNVTDTYAVAVTGHRWNTVVLPDASVTLAAGELNTIDVVVSIPGEVVQTGDTDTVTLTLTSQATSRLLFTQTFDTKVSSIPASVIVTAEPITLTADGSSSSNISVSVKDALNNFVADQTVVFTSSLGSITVSSVTNASGLAVATLTSSTTAGTATVAAIAGEVTGQAQVQFVAGSPATINLSASPAALLADGVSRSTVTAIVRDPYGNPVPNQTVAFAATLGTITSSAVTNADGVAYATLTSVQQVGQAQVTASHGGLSATMAVDFNGRMFAGSVFVDMNQNGIEDAGEPGLANVSVEMILLTLAADADRVVAVSVGSIWRTQTDAQGNYAIADLPLGEYRVALILPPGYAATTPTSFSITIGADQNQITAPTVGALARLYLPVVTR